MKVPSNQKHSFQLPEEQCLSKFWSGWDFLGYTSLCTLPAANRLSLAIRLFMVSSCAKVSFPPKCFVCELLVEEQNLLVLSSIKNNGFIEVKNNAIFNFFVFVFFCFWLLICWVSIFLQWRSRDFIEKGYCLQLAKRNSISSPSYMSKGILKGSGVYIDTNTRQFNLHQVQWPIYRCTQLHHALVCVFSSLNNKIQRMNVKKKIIY